MMLRSFSTSTQIAVVWLLIAALWLGGLNWFTRHVVERPDGSKLTSADAIVVLTGGSNRLQTGFDLLDTRKGRKMFISGVYHGVEVQELIALWRKEDPGNLRQSVVLGFKADDTVGNARETVEWLREEGYKSFYLVTSNYHMDRALLEFKIIAPALDIRPYPVAPEGLDMNNWWRNTAHRTLIISEYCKYLFALFRYSITESPA